MPSPIAHTAVAIALDRIREASDVAEPDTAVARLLNRITPDFLEVKKDLTSLLALLFFSILPDFDFLPGLFAGPFDQFHNTFSHSLFAGFIVALTVGGLVTLWRPRSFWYWFSLVLVCYELHVIMDYVTVGRGVMLFWPFTSDRYQPPAYLFYGLHRSDGWISIRHLWTFLTEMGFVLGLHLIIHLVLRIQKNQPSFQSQSLEADEFGTR